MIVCLILEKVQGITVDNASANTSFLQHLSTKIENFDFENQHFRCIAHIMNLGVQDMLKELKIQPEVVQEENSDDSDIENEDYSTPLSRLRSLINKKK